MNRFAFIVIAVIILLMAASLGFYWLVPKKAGGDHPETALGLDVKSSMVLMRINDGEVYFNGKILFAIGGEEAKHVDIKFDSPFDLRGGQVDGTIQVTIKIEQPVVLTKGAYEKIQNGMTYPQVGEILGSALARAQTSDGFSSRLKLIQGKHQIDLKFVDCKVTEKSAKDLE